VLDVALVFVLVVLLVLVLAGVLFESAVLEAVVVASLDVDFSVLLFSAPFAAVADLLSFAESFAPLFRKSVTYQPLPFRAKPGAVSCFTKVSAWHCGHAVNGGSEIFRITSAAWPQVSHL
jgi:hypothetical protein